MVSSTSRAKPGSLTLVFDVTAFVHVPLGGGIEVQFGPVFRPAFAGEDESSARNQGTPGSGDGFAQVADVYTDIQRSDHIVWLSSGLAQGVVQISGFQAVVQAAAARFFEHFG